MEALKEDHEREIERLKRDYDVMMEELKHNRTIMVSTHFRKYSSGVG